MLDTYVRRILNARIYDLAVQTPLERAPQLSARTGCHVLLKREDQQPVFSFKVRGAYNCCLNLSEAERARGVICASAGNHAQGLAMAAAHLGIKAVIVMPRTTPAIKVEGVRRRGGEVVLYGDQFDEAARHAEALVVERGLTYVPPYDHPDVIAGQGTVAVELLSQHPKDIDAVFIPVGGGGLCAGMAAYIKYLRPETRVVAVEPEDAACLQAALRAGKPVPLAEVGLFADGVAVAQIGAKPFEILQHTVDEVITVSTDEICAAIKDIFDDTRSIAEPAGACALAGLKKYAEREGPGKTLVAVHSGANTNFDRLRYISERTEIGEGREAVLAVAIPEVPGSYLEFCRVLDRRNITEFNYRYAGPGDAHIFVGLQVSPGAEPRRALLGELAARGYTAVDLTDDEVAKLHIRYMVGGHAPAGLDDEVVYRFEFPERPGALYKFLSRLAGRWNISMFHYRNHGAAYGRVLVGMQIPLAERGEVEGAMRELGYPFADETSNQAYQIFLK